MKTNTTSQMNGFCSKTEGSGATFEEIYLVEGKRTPFGKFMGSLSGVSPTDLAIHASKAVLEAAKIPGSEIDQTFAANIGQASADAFFLPRHVALYSGAPLASPALLLQRICGSGIEVIGSAAEQIAMGKGHLMLGVGTETMSRFPLASFEMRGGFPMGKPEFIDLLWEALGDTAAMSMGQTADNLAKQQGLTRAEVDAFAERSQARYAHAFEKNFFKDEIAPVATQMVYEREGLKPRKFKIKAQAQLENDEHPRKTSLEKLGQLPYVFTKEGPTTAGTASGIVDGACAVLVASGDYVKSHGLKPLGKIRAVSSVGVDPAIMGIGPVPAIRSVLKAANMSIGDIDFFEINEAFGAQCLAVAKALELNQDRLNVHGGAIAIGHPLAATGTRLATTVLKTLKRTGKQWGIASACIGGGQGIALLVEAV